MDTDRMTKGKIQKRFWELIRIADERWQETVDTFDMEPALLDILNFVKKYPEHKDVLEQCFIDLIYSKKSRASIDVLEYCMHELRWPNIKIIIEDILENTEDVRERDALHHIPEVYSDDWDGVEYYRYYSKE